MTGAGHEHSTDIAVIGMGAWGSALAFHCARLGHRVTGWHRDREHIATAVATKELPITQSCRLPLPANLRLTADLISGPSFAKDLAQQTPISLVAASSSNDSATKVATALTGSTVRLYLSNDPLGVELGGILKNVIAIAVGISDALGYGPSTRAALITRGLAEMTRVAAALGAQRQTLSGLSGLGDLVMTATDDQSRNRIVGLRLGKGETLESILATLGSTAEGVSSAPLVLALAQQHGIAAPLTEHVVRLMNGEIRATEMAHALMTRPLKSEF